MGQVVVSSRPGAGLQHEVQAGTNTLVADATKDVGGTETGMNPHELLLASLGACTSMTLQLFSQKRGWKLEHVKVSLTEETVDDAENPGKKVSRITRHIEIKGELDQEQVASLRKIADKCPIHKLLTESAKQVETNLESTSVETTGRAN